MWRYTLLLSLMTLVLLAITLAILYRQSIGNLAAQQQRDLELKSIEQRHLAENLEREDYLALLHRHNRSNSPTILALEETGGVLSFIPADIASCPAVSQFAVWDDDVGEIRKQRGCVAQTAHGRLLLSSDTGQMDSVREQFVRALALAAGIAILLSVLLAWLFSRTVLKRLKEINELCTTLSLAHDGASDRLPVSKRGDEFDATASYINHMLDVIDQSVRQIAEVTDAIAHDLRTPLSRLRIRLESLAKRTEPIPPKELEAALGELDVTLSIFQSMLELSRLEQHAGASFGTADLSQIVKDVVELAEPLYEAREQTLSTDIADSCLVAGDTNLLFRMCFNLLENASKYAGERANVTVELSECLLRVRDDGPGIQEAEIEKVLERFYRIDSSRSIPGHGLGLSFVRAICQLHRMDLTLSNADPGLDVVVQLPAKRSCPG